MADGVLTWEATDETHLKLADRVRAISSQALVGHLDRVAALLAGQTPAEPPRPALTTCADRTPLVDLEVIATLDVRHRPEAVWALVADASHAALESSDPAAVSFSAGARQGEVGELVCTLVGLPDGGRTASFQQVVGLRPGRSIVLRGLSAVAEHAWEREVVVEAAPAVARASPTACGSPSTGGSPARVGSASVRAPSVTSPPWTRPWSPADAAQITVPGAQPVRCACRWGSSVVVALTGEP